MPRKILVTASAMTGGFFLTVVLAQDLSRAWAWTASIAIGGAALVVQYLVDFGKRLEQFEKRSAEVLTATELFRPADPSPVRSDEVTRLVLAYTRIRERDGDLAQAFAGRRLTRLAELLAGLGSGSAHRPGEDHEWLISLTECARMTVDAVTTVADRDFWFGGPGDRYLAAQEKAVSRRGVEIRRLFVVRHPDEVTPELRALCEKHLRHGISVRIAVRSQLPSMPRVSDLVIFDGALCLETEWGPWSQPAGTWLKAESAHVEDRAAEFHELWAMAEQPQLMGPIRSFPEELAPDACRLLLVLMDDNPASGIPAEIELRVQPGPLHRWSEPGAARPQLVATATPLTQALIEPVSVELRPPQWGDAGAGQVLFTPERSGTHRIAVTVHDAATGTVLQRVKTTVHVTDGPAGDAPATPVALYAEVG
ncbi:hypothetical protein PGH47_27040 [Streptomyces sp. HUAS 31]|uniref:DUF6879 family protein n=1 Tax=Streptomyces sp. HUAS 31 TaxID=3020055 RepID=UPI0023060E08|nr:DUF6879 family protein [Streptomyces sp. HUAS 31]WCD99117.1 hypothetical protein PGH47_27040 [Streptomyces sp. HUAS 31]